MRKFLTFIGFSLLTVQISLGQEVSMPYTILFNPNAGEEFEIYIKDALDELEIESKIDYSRKNCVGNCIYYQDSIVGYNLKKLTIGIQENNEIIKSSTYSKNMFTSTLQSKKRSFELIEDLFNRETGISKKELRLKYPQLSGGAYIRKMDENIIGIETRGAAILSEKELINSFHTKATSLMHNYTGYEFYYEIGDYNYDAPSPYGSTSHAAKWLVGIVILNDKNIIEARIDQPLEFLEIKF